MNMELPIELYQEILDRSDFICQIRLTQLNKYLYKELKIYDFLNIQHKHSILLSNDVLKNYKYIIKLNTNNNPKITDEGIKYMKLHTLDAGSNSKITDEGISHSHN